MNIVRQIFEYSRTAWRAKRARAHVPDELWRRVCTRYEIPLGKIKYKNNEVLSVTFAKTTVDFPKTSEAMSVVSAYKLLCELDAHTACEMSWDQSRNSLKLAWGRAIYFADCHEEIYILSELYFVGDYDLTPCGECVIVDVGANVGFTSIFLADANPTLVVEGYEPLKLNFDKAERNLIINPHVANRVNFFNYGLFDADGIQVISSEVGNRGMSSIVLDRTSTATGYVQSESVKVVRASAVVRSVSKRHPGRRIAMKMDCEGSEYAIFGELAESGDLHLIDFVVMEWHRLTPTGREIDGLRDLLEKNGFHLYVRGRLQTLSSAGMAVAFRVPI